MLQRTNAALRSLRSWLAADPATRSWERAIPLCAPIPVVTGAWLSFAVESLQVLPVSAALLAAVVWGVGAWRDIPPLRLAARTAIGLFGWTLAWAVSLLASAQVTLREGGEIVISGATTGLVGALLVLLATGALVAAGSRPQ